MIQGKTGAGGRTLYSFSPDLNFTIVSTESFHLFFGQICALLNLFFAQKVPYSNFFLKVIFLLTVLCRQIFCVFNIKYLKELLINKKIFYRKKLLIFLKVKYQKK